MKRFLGSVLVLLVVAVGALAWTFRAATLEVPALGVAELPPASPPEGMTLSGIPTGAMQSLAAFAFRGGSVGDVRQFTMTPILVRHPKGALLFDAGFGRDVDEHVKGLGALMKATTTYVKGTPAAAQLAAGGFDPATLAGVVLTHAHWDHVSGLDALPNVPVWVSAAERDLISAGTIATTLLDRIAPAKFETYDFEGGPYLGFLRSHDVWGDGSIVLVPAPGHTPGSIVAFVTLPSGARYALLGDLVWQSEGIELPAERPWLSRRLVDLDPESVRRHVALVAAIHRRFPEIHMLPAHDAHASALLPTFPAVAR